MQTIQQDFQQENTTKPVSVKDFPYDERLSSSEMSQLWLLYQSNTSFECILKYFGAKAQDPDIKAMLNEAYNLIPPQINTMNTIFSSVGFPIPYGFSNDDVELNAKRLYSDSLMLSYLRMFNKFGLKKLVHALPLATRPDVRSYLNSTLVEAQNLLNKVEDLMARKGFAVKPPYTSVPDRVNFVTNGSWYDGLFGKKRPINILELTHVFERLETKLSERGIWLGFTQVAKDSKVKAYFIKGIDLSSKEIDRWSAILNNESMPLPFSWRGDVTDSTDSPFSDRLMLFHFLNDIAYSVTANGFALGNCNRADLITDFGKSIIELQTYGKDGLDLMIEKGWLEEIPLVTDRNKIIDSSH